MTDEYARARLLEMLRACRVEVPAEPPPEELPRPSIRHPYALACWLLLQVVLAWPGKKK